jgi:outer membrane protein assembly factor BamA
MQLTFNIKEGPQYQMGTLDFRGKPELVEELTKNWELTPGSPFDPSHLDTFLEKNKSLLAADFNALQNARAVRDCRANTVTVFLQLEPSRPVGNPPRETGCDHHGDNPAK